MKLHIGLTISIAAVLSFGSLSVKAWQVSHDRVATRLDEIQKQHGEMIAGAAVENEQIKEINNKLAQIETEKLEERMVRLEASSESNSWFLRAILVPLGFLALERLLAHAGVFTKRGPA